MTHPRTWPDATATILDAITGEGIAAYPAVPNPRPAEFVTVQRLGGARDQDGIFDQAQIDAVLSDYGAAAIKTGFLGRVDIIEAVAERLGYSDTSNFSRTFRRWLGMPPNAFRASRHEAAPVRSMPPAAGRAAAAWRR